MFPDICGVDNSQQRLMSPISLMSLNLELERDAHQAPKPLQANSSAQNASTHSLNLLVIVSNIGRVFCFILLIQQAFGHFYKWTGHEGI